MQSKGMDPQAVAQAVDVLRTSEQARAHEVWRKKFGSPANTPAERAKQVRFLAGRGFSGEAIARVVSGAFDAD
jgi:regulatory protein